MARKNKKYKYSVPSILGALVIFLGLGAAILLRPHSSINNVTGDTLGAFSDMSGAAWAEPAVDTLAALGITTGCGGGKYCPADNLSRDQAAVFILKSKHGGSYVPPSVSASRYSDVPPSHWAISWIEQLTNEGITTGCGGGKYCPSDPITRAQIAVMLLKAVNGNSYTPSAATGVFSDVPTSHWAANWIEALSKSGVTSGCATNPARFCPDNSVNRAEMAVFLVKAFKLVFVAPSPSPSPSFLPSPSPSIMPSPSPRPSLLPSPSAAAMSLLESFSVSSPCGPTSYKSIVFRCTGGVLEAIASNSCTDGVTALKKAVIVCINNGVISK